MAKTVSGHDAIRFSADPRLKRIQIPGTQVSVRVARPFAGAFMNLLVELNEVEPLLARNTWSFIYRKPRMGEGVSDHAGYAVDCWSDGIGAHTWPSKMPKAKAARISEILKGYKTADGRLIFGWGACKKAPGVDYPITYNLVASNDPMHFYIAPGVTRADMRG